LLPRWLMSDLASQFYNNLRQIIWKDH
jgi:hypothetical protein